MTPSSSPATWHLPMARLCTFCHRSLMRTQNYIIRCLHIRYQRTHYPIRHYCSYPTLPPKSVSTSSTITSTCLSSSRSSRSRRTRNATTPVPSVKPPLPLPHVDVVLIDGDNSLGGGGPPLPLLKTQERLPLPSSQICVGNFGLSSTNSGIKKLCSKTRFLSSRRSSTSFASQILLLSPFRPSHLPHFKFTPVCHWV